MQDIPGCFTTSVTMSKKTGLTASTCLGIVWPPKVFKEKEGHLPDKKDVRDYEIEAGFIVRGVPMLDPQSVIVDLSSLVPALPLPINGQFLLGRHCCAKVLRDKSHGQPSGCWKLKRFATNEVLGGRVLSSLC